MEEPRPCYACGRVYKNSRAYASHRSHCSVKAEGSEVGKVGRLSCMICDGKFQTGYEVVLAHHSAECKSIRLAVQAAAFKSEDDWDHNDNYGVGDDDDDGPLFGSSNVMLEPDSTILKREWANENPRIWNMDDLLQKNKGEEWKGDDHHLKDLCLKDKLELTYLYLMYHKGLSLDTVQTFVNIATSVHGAERISMKAADTRLKSCSGGFPPTPYDKECVRMFDYTTNPLFHVPQKIGNREPEDKITWKFRDMMIQSAESVFDKRIIHDVEHPIILVPNPRYNESRERVFSQLADGLFWERTHALINLGRADQGLHAKTVFLLKLYIDGTQLSGKGSFSAVPVFVKVGNLHPDCAERDEAWVFLGFIPPLKSPGTKYSEAAKRYRLQYYHDALRFLLQPLVTCHKDGGFTLTIEGRLYWFVPFLAVMVQDSKEGFVLCGQCLGGGTAYPCRLCWVTKIDSSDPAGSSARFRFASENQSIVALLRGSKGLTNTQRAQGFSKLSVLNVNSAFTDVPFGAQPYGINGAAQPDVLHQYLLGIMKRLVVNVLKLIVSKKDPSVLVKKVEKLKRFMTKAPSALEKEIPGNAEILKQRAVRGDAARLTIRRLRLRKQLNISQISSDDELLSESSSLSEGSTTDEDGGGIADGGGAKVHRAHGRKVGEVESSDYDEDNEHDEEEEEDEDMEEEAIEEEDCPRKANRGSVAAPTNLKRKARGGYNPHGYVKPMQWGGYVQVTAGQKASAKRRRQSGREHRVGRQKKRLLDKKWVRGNDRIQNLDRRIAHVNTRHNNDNMPRKSFNQGCSHLPTDINATEYPALLWHLLVVLGLNDSKSGGTVLPTVDAIKVAKLIRRVLHVHNQLWKLGHTESELKHALPKKIEDMLRHFRIAFPFDPCTFPKFHMTTHLPYQILMNGNVREGDAGSGERQHKTQIKQVYLRTQRHYLTFLDEMLKVIALKRRLQWLVDQYKLHTLMEQAPVRAARPASADENVDETHGLLFEQSLKEGDAAVSAGELRRSLTKELRVVVRGVPVIAVTWFIKDVFDNLERLDHPQLQAALAPVIVASDGPSAGSGGAGVVRPVHAGILSRTLSDVINGGGGVRFYSSLVCRRLGESSGKPLTIRNSSDCYRAAWDDWVLAKICRKSQTRVYACRVIAIFRIFIARVPVVSGPNLIPPFLLVERHESKNSDMLGTEKIGDLTFSVDPVAGVPIVKRAPYADCSIVSADDIVEGAWAVTDPDDSELTWVMTEQYLGDYEILSSLNK